MHMNAHKAFLLLSHDLNMPGKTVGGKVEAE